MPEVDSGVRKDTLSTPVLVLILVLIGAAGFVAFLFRVLDLTLLVTLLVAEGVVGVLSRWLHRFQPGEKEQETTSTVVATSGPGGFTHVGPIYVSRDLTFHPGIAPSDQPPTSSTPSAVIEVCPLPHMKGYILPPKIETKILDGQRSTPVFTNVGATTPDRINAEASQVIDAYWQGPDWKDVAKDPHDAFIQSVRWESLSIKELIVKFGVLRVYVSKGDAIGCRAELRFLTLSDALGAKDFQQWGGAGFINWSSRAIRNRVVTGEGNLNEIDQKRGLGLNKYLRNSTEDIHTGESRDLLLFYMIKDQPSVFLCTDVDITTAGLSFDGKPVRFQAEVALAAQGCPRAVWRYEVTAAWDDFLVRRI